MPIVKVSHSGNRQTLHLPKQFWFKSKEVEIFRLGDEVVLREARGTMKRVFDLLVGMPEDFDPRDRRRSRSKHAKSSDTE